MFHRSPNRLETSGTTSLTWPNTPHNRLKNNILPDKEAIVVPRRKNTIKNEVDGGRNNCRLLLTPMFQQSVEESDSEEREGDYAKEISEWNMQYL